MVGALLDMKNVDLYDFKVSVVYHDLGRQRAWRSLGRLRRQGNSDEFALRDVDVTDIALEEAQ